MPAKLKTDLPDFTIFTDGKGRLCQVWKGKYYPDYTGEGYFGSSKDVLHRDVWKFYNGEIPKGHHIHHKDGNKSNNHINNLECISSSDHSKLHNKENASKGLLYLQQAHGRKAQSELQKKRALEGKLHSQTKEFRIAQSNRRKNAPYRTCTCIVCGASYETNTNKPTECCRDKKCQNIRSKTKAKLKKLQKQQLNA